MIKIINIFLICALLFIGGCDSIYRVLQKEGAEEKELIGEVLPFESNPTVQEIQALLKIYGYNPGGVDGMLGGRTREAIVQFQKDQGLKETRFVDKETWKKLKFYQDIGLIENSDLNGKLIQKILKDNGFYAGVVDGSFGPKTQKAVKDFQKKNHLKVDGRIGYQTLSRLYSYLSLQQPQESSKDRTL